MRSQGSVPNHLSKNQPSAQNEATDANNVIPAA